MQIVKEKLDIEESAPMTREEIKSYIKKLQLNYPIIDKFKITHYGLVEVPVGPINIVNIDI